MAMIKQENLKVGLQVMYVPDYVRKEFCYRESEYWKSPDVEIGFVTSWVHDKLMFCRFFYRTGHGLRTVANSESCYPEDLFEINYYDQRYIDRTIEMLRKQPEKYGWVEQKKE